MSDLDAMLDDAPVESTVLSRWERKALQAANKNTTPVRARAASSAKTPKTGTKTKTPLKYCDRFIPSREGMDLGAQLHSVANENCDPNPEDGFNNRLAQTLFRGEDINSKVLAFKKKAPKPTDGFQNNLRVIYSQNKQREQAPLSKKAFRAIASTPERILDAPDLLDDYYLNLMDWSPQNLLAIALGPCVYLWNAETSSIDLLCESSDPENLITSVKWMADGSHIAVGNSDAQSPDLQMWDVSRKKQVRSLKGHAARVGSLAWNQHVLSSGSRDNMIFHHDVRVKNHHFATLQGHEQEVCGLAWSDDGTQLASGSNDNKCMIWDFNMSTSQAGSTPLWSLEDSQAAVKALAWCPFERNLLATGSGTADRHIRFYNTGTGSMVNSIDTQSQVCSLQWSKNGEKELLSSHGFSQNQLCLWKYPTMVKVAELTGHSSRVLHTAVSPDGTTVCSAAADETLRFWKVWDPVVKRKSNDITSATSRMMKGIR